MKRQDKMMFSKGADTVRRRLGFDGYVAILILNAGIIFSPYQTSAARIAHRGNGKS